MNLLPFAIVWALLATVVIALAFYRRTLSAKEDDMLHVNSVDASSQQIAMGKKLDSIDRWGKLLTIAAAVTGAVLLGAYMYQSWLGRTSGY